MLKFPHATKGYSSLSLSLSMIINFYNEIRCLPWNHQTTTNSLMFQLDCILAKLTFPEICATLVNFNYGAQGSHGHFMILGNSHGAAACGYDLHHALDVSMAAAIQ